MERKASRRASDCKQLRDGADQVRRLDRLGNVRVRSQRQAPLPILFGALGRDDDDRDVAELLVLTNHRHELEPVHRWHIDVRQNQIGLALNIAVYALVLLYFLHSLALLLLPRLNPELYRSVTAPIPVPLQRVAAVVSMIFMTALLTQMTLPTIGLLLFWAAVGVVIYAVAHGRTARRIKHADETKLA